MTEPRASVGDDGVAIIGMAGRWPNARNVAEFWRNVRDGRECIDRFPADKLEVAGASELASRPDYVRARSVLEEVDQFDAAFFGVLPREAELMDPQHRVFLECCWEALEDAGYNPHAYSGAIGVFAGCSNNTYFLHNVCAGRSTVEEYAGSYPLGDYATMFGAIADSLATRVAYKLNLRGPAMTIQTACSTSLVAVCQACQSLLSYQTDMALAGGVAITFPQKRGYVYQEGAMGSADGRCRPFDANARGTVFGSGAGVVLLKRLEDALSDGDPIRAVIRGFAVNNDGSGKVGYTAPSVDGQAAVVAMAHTAAGVDPETITYLESHGTATPLGDPIEFAALVRAFRTQTQAKNFCALGAVKAHVGHLEAAAGVTGLISAVQALVHEQLPPVIGFESPNPNIDLENSPFYVNTRLAPWNRGQTPRRAGVSSFGVGGTNAHIVLEESPPVELSRSSRPGQLLILSARSDAALDEVTRNLTEHMKSHPDTDLASVAYTLQTGRRAFEHRRSVACVDVADAIQVLANRNRCCVHTRHQQGRGASVVFMFPGQGSQYVGMGSELYRMESTFRSDVDTCVDLLQPHLGCDLRVALGFGGNAARDRRQDLTQTALAQPALFVIEYALARLWMRWGVRPQAMFGHSVGEFVAACLAGVFSLEDALAIVAERGRLMQQLPPGAMVSVRLGEAEVTPLLNGELSVAATNGPRLSVVAGPLPAIEKLECQLSAQGVAARRLATSHAFHSQMMDPILEPFAEFVSRFPKEAPQLPYISCLSGTWVTKAEVQDPNYWSRHFREPVRFSQGIQLLRTQPDRLFLEVGPGRVLCTLAGQHREPQAEPTEIASLPDAASKSSDLMTMLNAAGVLWLYGVTPDWTAMHGSGARRCPLPTYPFERQRYWIDPPKTVATPAPVPTSDNQIAMTMPRVPDSPKSASPVRSDRLRAALIDIFQERSGLNLGDCDPAATFLELGFDSLFLTQITQALQTQFGLRVTFRQLLEQQSSLGALADYLDAKLPAEAFPVAPAAGPAPTQLAKARSNSAISETPGANQATIEAIVREQLQAMSQLMAKQLEFVRGTAPVAEIATPPVTSIVVPDPNEPTAPQVFTSFVPFKPVRRGPEDGLTERQSRHLDTLVRRYTARTAESKELAQRRRQVLADPRVVAGFRSQWKELVYPIVTIRSHGTRLWDVDGNEYIDLLNGFGSILFGHAPDFVAEAVAAQLKEGFEIGPQTPLAGEVAELVRDLTGSERVTFCNTGSEAVMAALRVARTVTGRKKVVLFAGAYHGTMDEVLVKGIPKGGQPHSLPVAPGIPDEKVANVVVLEYGAPVALEYIRRYAHELAAVLVEPIQSRHPDLRPIEFLHEVRRITEQSGTALIFDEVVTGFRIHPGGAQALFGIRADLATYGKVAGGGLPIGIVAGKARFMDALDGGIWQYGDDSFPETGVTFFAGTFVRHPLALAAARAVLQRLKDEGPDLQEKLNARTSTLVNTLNEYFAKSGFPLRIAHFASWFYFSFPVNQPHGSLLYYHLREKGVHIQEGFPCFLTTAHTDADLAAVDRAFQGSVTELQAGGFLLGPNNPEAQPSGANLTGEYAPTESQLEVWLAARVSDEASCAFNEAFTLELRGELNRSALQAVLQILVDRHDALRSTFDPTKNCIRVLEGVSIEMQAIDLCEMAPKERAARMEKLIREDAGQPFDLATGPLVRVKLITLEPGVHTILFTTHHIVCDGWSTNVLLDELSQLYDARVADSVCKLPAATPFHVYARAQAEWRHSPEFAAVESWWAECFATPVMPLELPTDRPRAAVKSYHGGTKRRVIGAGPYRRLKEIGAQHGCTLFAVLLTGFKALLYRLTGQGDVVVGIPAAGQSVFGANNLVGHCVNFLPLRSTIAGEQTVADLLARVRSTLLDAYDHQNYTYGSLVQKLGLKRDPSRLPLVEVQFNLERVGGQLAFSGLRTRVDACPKSFVNFDLFLNAVESDEGLVFDCDYNRDLFDGASVERWLGHLETLLEGMVADPQMTVATIPLLSDVEKHRLLVEWNDTAVVYPRDKSVHQLIAEQAAQVPEAIAVVCGHHKLTYAQLEADSNRLAHYMRRRGVGPGCRVAVCLERSLDMVIGVLGVLKAGAAYIPLDPEFPAERVAAVLADANPTLILTQSSVASHLEMITGCFVKFDEARPEVDRESDSPLSNVLSPESPAYVIYTSGSTGQPKGVQVPHRAIVNLLTSMASRPGLSASDTMIAVTTLAFDIAALELYLPLCVGAKVVIATPEIVCDGHELLNLIRSSNATIMQATPATWRLLLEAGWDGPSDFKVLCGGEALPRDLADALRERSASVWNLYGPTETTVWSAVAPVEPGPGPVTIGPPIANTQFYILDSVGQPTPPGVAGELHIGGDGVATGYWNRPDLTAEKFVRDPFRGQPGARMFKTGDLVRARPQGTLEFLGRFDKQVKVRGFRIETSEVELVLRQFPSLRDCVVMARSDAPGEKQLVAYYTSATQTPATNELRRFVASKLPAYMVPDVFIQLESLPHTPNGKIDLRLLLVPDAVATGLGREFVAPRNPREQKLAAICAEVLGLETISVFDSLFELGGDSIRLFQIVARASAAGLALTPSHVLTGRTVSGICDELERAVQSPHRADAPKITAVPRDQHRRAQARLTSSERSDR